MIAESISEVIIKRTKCCPPITRLYQNLKFPSANDDDDSGNGDDDGMRTHKGWKSIGIAVAPAQSSYHLTFCCLQKERL